MPASSCQNEESDSLCLDEGEALALPVIDVTIHRKL